MTLRYLLDTNIVIEVLRTRPAHLAARFARAEGTLAIAAVTAAELAYGAEGSARPLENQAAVDEFLARLQILPLDSEAAQHSGRIRAELARAGTPIGGYDLLIAGTARSRGLVVVTNNRREFERVDGLLLEDWNAGDWSAGDWSAEDWSAEDWSAQA